MIQKKKKRFAPFESPSWSLLEKPEGKLNRVTRQFFTETVDTKQLVKRKNPKADLRFQHKKVYELSFAITLGLLITTFQLARLFSLAPTQVSEADLKIEVADIPQTEQFHRPPKPVRPTMPIPTEEESVPEDLTIASTEIDLSAIPPPPAPPDEDNELSIFIAYDEPPQIIGGVAALQKYLKYPRLAQDAGIEGVVFVKVLISVNGQTEKMAIIKAKPTNMGFEEAAMNALIKISWQPAKQRDKKIRCWITVPVQFNLLSS